LTSRSMLPKSHPLGSAMYPSLRPGNLVRHKSGGPIMLVTMAYPRLPMMRYVKYECTWIDNQQKMVADFEEELLQPVYADGSPRTYTEKLAR
jgi:uncharacterized protein YodC (DUF2158 family)